MNSLLCLIIISEPVKPFCFILLSDLPTKIHLIFCTGLLVVNVIHLCPFAKTVCVVSSTYIGVPFFCIQYPLFLFWFFVCLSVSMSLFPSVTINLVRINATNPLFQITEEMSSYSVSVIGAGVYGNVQVNLVSDRKGVSVVTLIQFDLLDMSKNSKRRKTITVESCRP